MMKEKWRRRYQELAPPAGEPAQTRVATPAPPGLLATGGRGSADDFDGEPNGSGDGTHADQALRRVAKLETKVEGLEREVEHQRQQFQKIMGIVGAKVMGIADATSPAAWEELPKGEAPRLRVGSD